MPTSRLRPTLKRMAANSTPAADEIGPFEIVVLTLSVVVLAALVADTFLRLPAEVSRVLGYLDVVVCGVFLIDFLRRLYRAPSKRAFMKWGWIDLLASIPNIEALRIGRLVRVLQIIRLLRSLRTLQRVWQALFTRRAHGGIASVGIIAFLVISFASVAVLVCENTPQANIRTAEDAVWWSITTVTTVGYGDKYPVTTAGRVIAAMLMITGVGLFGTLSGIVATVFIGGPKAETDRALAELRELRAEIAELRHAQQPPSSPSTASQTIEPPV